MNKKILLGQRLFTGRKKKPLVNNYTISLINFFVKDVFWMYFGLPSFAFQKNKGGQVLRSLRRARGQRCASRNHEAVVFP
jgi:hypothetical protein